MKTEDKYKIYWTAPAKRDLSDIIEYISLDSKSRALAVLNRIEKRTNLLSESPEQGRCLPELEKFNVLVYREIIEIPWRIIYKLDKQLVYIISVIDSRRNIEIHLGKILSR